MFQEWNGISSHCVKHSLAYIAGRHLGEEMKVKETGEIYKKASFLMPWKKCRANFNLNSFGYVLFHLVRKCLEDTFLLLLLNTWNYSISTFGSLLTKPCLTFWLRTCTLLGCGPQVWRLPTHTALIYKSVSWLAEGAKAECFVSPSEEKAKMMVVWLSSLSKGPPDLDDGPSNMTGLWYLQEESQTIPPVSREDDWVPVLTYLTRIRAMAVFTHPLRISRFIPFHKILGEDTNYTWHHIVKTLSRTAAWKGAWTGERQRWKEAPGCHIESIVDFFQDQTCPIVEGNQPCLPVDVW